MSRQHYAENGFILGAFDRDQWCSVLQALFRADDIDALRVILGLRETDDPALQQQYVLDERELAAVLARFNVAFDPGQLACKDLTIFLFRRPLVHIPYLVHAGYELPLLIAGRKKLAILWDVYPPLMFKGEDRFDRYVAEGLLYKEEVLQPFDRPSENAAGHRQVYYTPKGEEWRISAHKLIRGEFGKAGQWNEIHERLEGILFGYADWQNDWWVNYVTARGGSFTGMALCCAVGSAGLAWIKSAGFRALPPVCEATVRMSHFDPDAEVEMRAFMSEHPSSIALVRFNLAGRHLMDIADLRCGGPFEIPSDRIPELNRHLIGSVVVALLRDESA